MEHAEQETAGRVHIRDREFEILTLRDWQPGRFMASRSTRWHFAAMSEALEAFGRVVMEKLRDKAFATADLTLRGHWKAPSLLKLQTELGLLNDGQRDLARRLVRSAVDSAIHDFLFALQEAGDSGGSIAVLVNGENVASKTDGLHGEASGDKGWQAKFSRYGKAPEEA